VGKNIDALERFAQHQALDREHLDDAFAGQCVDDGVRDIELVKAERQLVLGDIVD